VGFIGKSKTVFLVSYMKTSFLMLFRNTSSSHGAKISLVCDSTMSKDDTEFKYLNVTEGPTEYYVSNYLCTSHSFIILNL